MMTLRVHHVLLGSLLFLFSLAPLSASDIPSSWNYKVDGLDSFPVLDFTKEQAESTDQFGEEVEEKFEKLERKFDGALSQKDLKKARSIAEKAAEKFPNFYRTGDLFVELIEKRNERGEETEKLIERCQELIKRFPRETWSLTNLLEDITDTEIDLSSYDTAPIISRPGSSPTLDFEVENLDQVQITVYRVDPVQMMKSGIPLQSPTVPPNADPVKKWTYNTEEGDDQTVDLRVTEKGTYLVSLGTPYYTVNTLAFVSDLALMTKTDGEMLLSYGADMNGKKPGESQVVVADKQRIIYEGTSNEDGVFAARLKGDASNALVLYRRGKDVAVSYSRWSRYPHGEIEKVHFQTDRPVYRPGQTVHVKLIFRRFDDKRNPLIFKKNEERTVTLEDPKGNDVMKKDVNVNKYGTASFSYELADEPRLGDYHIKLGENTLWGDHNYSFSVKEYKKPHFEVSVKPRKPNGIIGEQTEFEISAEYHFGEPVAGAKVEYRVFAESTNAFSIDPTRKKSDRYSWWFEESARQLHLQHHFLHGAFEDEDEKRYEKFNLQGHGRLNDNGTLNISFSSVSLKKLDKDFFKLHVSASVTDKSRRAIAGSGSMILGNAKRRVSLTPERWSFSPDEPVTLHLRTVELGGDPISDTVICKISRRTDDGDDLSLFRKEVHTNEQGEGTLRFQPKKQGRYRIEAKVTDRKGRTVTNSDHVWVASRSWHSPYEKEQELNLKADQKGYVSGDHVRITATTAQKNFPVLFTAENGRILGYQVQKFSGSMAIHERDLTSEDAPEVKMQAHVFAENRHLTGEEILRVAPPEKFLQVEVEPNKKTYKPGEQAEWTLRLTDHRGNPVQGELSFVLVDEAIYQIKEEKTEDLRKLLYNNIWGRVDTETSFDFLAFGVGKGQTVSSAENQTNSNSKGESTGTFMSDSNSENEGSFLGGAFKAGKEKISIRSNFADTAIWKPHLETDENGEVTVRMTMPDDLTSWRATVIAIDEQSRAGQATTTVRTRQDLMVRLAHPRTFTETDQVTVSSIVHNYLPDAKTSRVTLKSDGAELTDGKHRRTIQLPPNAKKRIDWRLDVNSPKSVTLQTSARTDEQSDGLKRTVNVVPYGVKIVEGDGGLLTLASDPSNANMTFSIPEGGLRKTTKLTVSASPSLGGTLFEGLEYLTGYPYGCVEQTMSRFLPNIAVQKSMNRLGIRNPDLSGKIDEYTRKGLQRLYNFQHDDGGWGWWKRDDSDPYMTAYVMYGLARARDAGYQVSRRVLGTKPQDFHGVYGYGGMGYLRNQIPEVKNLDTRAYMLYSHSQYKEPESSWIQSLMDKHEQLNDFGMALLLLTLSETDRNEKIKTVRSRLIERASTDGRRAWWGESNRNDHWASNQLQSTAFALKALVRTGGDPKLIGRAVRYLITARRGNKWRSTKDTAAVLLALSEYIKKSNELQANYSAEIRVNGKRIDRFRVTPEMFSFSKQKKSKESGNEWKRPEGFRAKEYEIARKHLREGKNRIEIRQEGDEGNLYFNASLRRFARGNTLTKRKQNGIKVTRKYVLLEEKETERRLSYERTPLKDGAELTSGDEIEVRLTVEAEEARYLMLEDPLPAGCEVIENKRDLDEQYDNWWNYSSRREVRDEKVVFFNSHLDGENTFIYTLRAETPGQFHVMPARAELMYSPDVNGHTPMKTITIQDKTGSKK